MSLTISLFFCYWINSLQFFAKLGIFFQLIIRTGLIFRATVPKIAKNKSLFLKVIFDRDFDAVANYNLPFPQKQ